MKRFRIGNNIRNKKKINKQNSHATGERILSVAERVLGHGFYRSQRIVDEMTTLYPGKEGQRRLREFYAAKIEKSAAVLGLAVLIGILVLVFSETALLEGNSFARAEPGGTDEEYEVIIEDSRGRRQAVNVNVSSRQYSYEEAALAMEQALSEMDEMVLGDNESFDRVMYDLNMPSALEPGLISIEWNSSDYNIMDDKGEIDTTALTGRGDPVTITGILKYQDLTMEYTRKLTVYPLPLTEEEQWLASIDKALGEADLASAEEESMTLPQSIDGDRVTWMEKRSSAYIIIILLGVVAAVALYYNEDKKLKDSLEKRKREMEIDYSEILNKMVLLLGAGMTMRSVWERISMDYKRFGSRKRFAYEEMLLTLNEIKSGASERTAYEHFGIRCSGTSFMKLAATLTQNLRKGSKGLLEIFEREAYEAKERRKSHIKKQGEEAGTRLLIPMVMMLAVVLMIVIVPAFRSMNL